MSDKCDDGSRGDVPGDAGKREADPFGGAEKGDAEKSGHNGSDPQGERRVEGDTNNENDGGDETHEARAPEAETPSAVSPAHAGPDSDTAGSGDAPYTRDITIWKVPERPRRDKTYVWRGIGIGALLHLVLLLYPAAYFAIGIVQLLYIVPALMICRKNPGLVQGLLIAAGITFLLNAACFGYVMISLRSL